MRIKNKKVLVTGACGFIGSHLTERLLKEGCNVKALVYYNSFNSWGWLDTFTKDKLKEVEVLAGDVRDPVYIKKAMRNIDAVFHLAALIGIPFSYSSVDSYIDTNTKGTLNILQACRDNAIERVVVTSTSEVYGTARYVPIDEKHPLQPQSPYSASKIASDALAESFHRSFDVPVVIARPFNTYGPRQSARAIVATIITQLLSSGKEVKLGSLHPTRDLSYVEDVCDGFVSLAECDKAIGRAVNIGSGREISIKDLAQLVIKIINPQARVVLDKTRKRPPKSEVERLLCDNTVIRKLTGWKPKVPLEEGIKRTIKWFSNKENLSRYKWDIYNV